jgi:hypothetical protein
VKDLDFAKVWYAIEHTYPRLEAAIIRVQKELTEVPSEDFEHDKRLRGLRETDKIIRSSVVIVIIWTEELMSMARLSASRTL